MRVASMTTGKTKDRHGKEHWVFAEGPPLSGEKRKAVQLDVEGLTDFILSKVKRRRVEYQNANKCAAYILAHNGINTGGGCPDKVKYKGKTVFHHSTGQRGLSNGCAVFFANSGGGKAILLAVGRHDKDVKRKPHYDLDWTHSGWYAGGGIQF